MHTLPFPSYLKACSTVRADFSQRDHYTYQTTSGIHAVLMLVSTQILFSAILHVQRAIDLLMPCRQRGRSSRANQILSILVCAPFVLSSAYWAIEIAEQAERANISFMRPKDENRANITAYAPLFNSIIFVNVSLLHQSRITYQLKLVLKYFCGDTIVIFRYRILYETHQHKTSLIPMVLLTITARECHLFKSMFIEILASLIQSQYSVILG